jgi:hypothetical protein
MHVINVDTRALHIAISTDNKKDGKAIIIERDLCKCQK